MRAVVLLWCAAAFAQDPAGVVQGTVQDAATHTPLAGVEIGLRGPLTSSAITGTAGKYRFEKLPAGNFSLVVKKEGYIDFSHGRPTDSLRIATASSEVTYPIAMMPLSSISGRVLGEDGRPLAGVIVAVPQTTNVTTSADGRFRLENLGPRDYRVVVRVPFELQRQTLHRDTESGESFGYANVYYYPGVDDQTQSSELTVTPGAQLEGVEIRLRHRRLVSLAGKTIESIGRGPLSSAEVELLHVGSTPYLDATNRRRPVAADGAFRFELILPGAYSLNVYRSPREDDLPFVTRVEVGNAGIEDFALVVPPFVDLRGTVRLSDDKDEWKGSLRVLLSETRGGRRGLSVPVAEDGTFKLERVPPGQWRLQWEPTSDLHRVAAPDRRLYVSAVRFGGQDVMWNSVTIAEGGNPPLDVLLSDEVAQIAGTVSKSGAPAADAFVVVRRTGGESNLNQFLMPAVTKADGSFQVPNLVPGEYEVTAWARDPSGVNSFDTQRCGQRMATTKVAAGQTSVVTLQTCN